MSGAHLAAQRVDRRGFLRGAVSAAVLLGSAPGCLPRLRGQGDGVVMTVRGPIRPGDMGITLPHEHVMSTFGAPITPGPDHAYRYEELAEAVLPHLLRAREQGVRTLIDPTAAYFGRSPAALRRLAETSGVQIVTNTGYYGAADDRYVPEHARVESAEQLAARWLREWEHGIGDTGVRPGFIKVGVDAGPLSAIDAKLFRAAAQAHRGSGLTIAAHTGDNPAAVEGEWRILREEGVDPSAWVWVHAHKVADEGLLAEAAERGGWISLDGVHPDTLEIHLRRVLEMRRRGLLGQVLLSHDGNTFRPGGGAARPYHALLAELVPALRERGMEPDEIEQLLVDNPRRAFTVRVRAA